MERCCEVKEELAFTRESFFPVFNVIPGRDINRIVTRDEFERCIEPYMRRVERCMDDLFTRAGVSQQDITRVIKVGGSSRIPAMTALLTDMVGPNKVYSGLRESLCVAEGAAIYAAYLDDPEVFGRDIEITTRTCHALGVEVRGGEFYELIPANRKTPCTREQLFEPESPDQKEVDVEVYQGSSRFVKDNTKIGTVRIPLEPERDRKPDIKVTFKLDAEQMLAVVVKVKFADGGEKEYREAFRFN
jgi:molecular chaperone DnaK (HSP70)